jgi:predicted nucleic acid-binding protein
MARLLVDTDILFDAGRGDAVAVHFLTQTAQYTTLAMSTVTQMELMVGYRNKEDC